MGIKRSKIFLLALFLIFVIGCSNNLTTSEITNYETKSIGSTESGDVFIELTPLNIKDGKLNIKVDVNTHTVELAEFDLKQLTTLEYNSKFVKPVEVPNLKGHHSSGILVFDLKDNINIFKIKIRGIPIDQERTFEWNNE